MTGAALRNALEQETFGAQATRLQTFLDTHDATNFAAMQMMRDRLRLRVLWKGAVPTQLREFALTLPSDVPVVVKSVAYSTADWEAASKALFAAYGYDRRKPKAWSVNGTSAGDFSGIEVSVYKDQKDFPDPDMQEVKRILADISPMPIHNVTYAYGALTSGAGRLADVPPSNPASASSPTSAP